MARNIFDILDELTSGINELKMALSPFALSGRGSQAPRRGRPMKAAAATTSNGRKGSRKLASKGRRASTRPGAVKKARRRASPKLRKLRALQGKYLGALRNLTLPQRNQVKKVKADGGYEPALKLAASLRK